MCAHLLVNNDALFEAEDGRQDLNFEFVHQKLGELHTDLGKLGFKVLLGQLLQR
jgi:hypothetical protein